MGSDGPRPLASPGAFPVKSRAMFGTQSTDRKRFVIGLLWRIGLFIAVTIALPLLLATFGSGCKASSSDCQGAGLMMIVAYFGLGPLALVLFVISLPSLLIPRFRAIGISPWW